ncbi:hypothetical protein [Candidatus Laterigemmans baculatus]|uniref:hypothetical protein n=1 Tax=Candidatus Laterigemmans baculatus TaxID=2770505 RepID=UPI0013DC3B72|nr:hypothetical protein [Candidatus Laterigemmans baculatus]
MSTTPPTRPSQNPLPPQRRGPAGYRLLIWIFSLTFAVLCYWLLGFILRDIGRIDGPQYRELEAQMLDPELLTTDEDLADQLAEAEREIADLSEQQRLLGASIANSQQTVNQLLEIQRLSIEKETELTEEEMAAMTSNLQLFLENQREYQALNSQISELTQTRQTLREQKRLSEQALAEARGPIQEEFEERLQSHNLKLAGLKLAVLLPLLIVILLLFLRYKESLYAPMMYAAGGAISLKVLMVMHEHFPAEYFKYILIAISLIIVAWILVHLLRMLAFPKRDWLIKQYREAYASFFCPVCEFPIQRGPLKFRAWTRRTIRKARFEVGSGEGTAGDRPYWCPACHTQLYEECSRCHATRHSLLGTCEKCGAEKLPLASDAGS